MVAHGNEASRRRLNRLPLFGLLGNKEEHDGKKTSVVVKFRLKVLEDVRSWRGRIEIILERRQLREQ